MNNHAFSAALWYFAKGSITRADVVAAFDMTTDDEIQLDQISTHYAGLSAADKRAFHSDVEAAGILAEGEYITKAKYKTLLGLT